MAERPFARSGIVVLSLIAALTVAIAPRAGADPQLCTDLILVLDESGSIAPNEDTVRASIAGFLDGLTDTGVSAAVIEFGSAAHPVLGYTAVTSSNNTSQFFPYLDGTSGGDVYDSPSQTGLWTNWDDALDKTSDLNAADHVAPLVLFVTDGDPTAYNRDLAGEDGGITTGASSDPQALIRAVAEADTVKAQGSHIIAVGVGAALTSAASLGRLQSVAGPDVYDGTGDLDLALTDVILVPDFSDLPQVMAQIAQAMCADPAIAITKVADSAQVVAGSPVTYTIEVTNTGNVPLFEVTVTDPLVPECSTAVGDLALGATVSYTCTTTLWAPLTNTATAGGTDEFGTEVTDSDSASVGLVAPGTGTPGYWKNHTDVWPAFGDTVLIGDWNHDGSCGANETCLALSTEEALAAISTPPRGDSTRILARALFTAWLNVSAGNDASCIAATIDEATAWLLAHPIGSGVAAGSDAGADAVLLAEELDYYNNGGLCAEHRDDKGGDDATEGTDVDATDVTNGGDTKDDGNDEPTGPDKGNGGSRGNSGDAPGHNKKKP